MGTAEPDCPVWPLGRYLSITEPVRTTGSNGNTCLTQALLDKYPKDALLGRDLVTVGAILVQWTHCHVQETNLKQFELCEMVHYPAGSARNGVSEGMDMVRNNAQLGHGI